jgi:hypothetical protein
MVKVLMIITIIASTGTPGGAVAVHQLKHEVFASVCEKAKRMMPANPKMDFGYTNVVRLIDCIPFAPQ